MDSSPYSTTSEIFAVGGEDYLKEGHTPTTLPERQEEILKLRRSLKPAARGAGAENTFLSGKAGQGKTAAAKAELSELEAFAEAQALDLNSLVTPEFGPATSTIFTRPFPTTSTPISWRNVGCEIT
ncbi:hypothetical protein [Halostella sp. PRR32]|uniref:hypothetical protein n=1 Tax=Halostella sp. PRR32 TaxID=3098147 RepID=UPI002B1D1815|nr:hypothetical protein [Halostella sp. PRR32]